MVADQILRRLNPNPVDGCDGSHEIYIIFVGHKSTFRISLKHKNFIDGIKDRPLVLFGPQNELKCFYRVLGGC